MTANTINDNTVQRIKNQIQKNTVLLYMKGSPDFPMCGFSSRVAHILKSLNTEFAYVNILENPDIRKELPRYAKWPTFPQLYINQELIGGCDIVSDLHTKGELQPLLHNAGALKSNAEVQIAQE